jgi:hypothetical protein
MPIAQSRVDPEFTGKRLRLKSIRSPVSGRRHDQDSIACRASLISYIGAGPLQRLAGPRAGAEDHEKRSTV